MPASLCRKVFLLLCQGDQLNVAWWTQQGFFFAISLASNRHFPGNCPRLSLLTVLRATLLSFLFFLPSLFQNYFNCLIQDFMFSSRFLKTKRRVILIFFGGGEIFLEVSAAELINSIEHNYECEQSNKTSGKKVVQGAKQNK